MNLVEEISRKSFPVPTDEEIWEWANREIDFGNLTAFRGKYNVENVPWTREMLRACRDPFVREITAIMPPQESGKTKAAEVCLAWRAVHHPAPMAFNTTTNVKAETWSETRWEQLQQACPDLRERFSENRNHKKKRRVIFRDGTFLLIQGAETDSNRQSDSVEFQINDELMLWENGWHSQMIARTRAYRETRKVINISLGSNTGTELENRFLEGNQLEWSHLCPACGRPIQYIFDQRRPDCNIRFDLKAVLTYEDRRLDLREFEKTIFATCNWEHCAEKITYDPDLWARLNAAGRYVARNPKADPSKISMHVNAFAIGRRPWVEILEPWVRLNLRGGIFNMEILREFITEDLCEFWADRPIVVNSELKLGSYHRADVKKPPVFRDGKCVSGWADEWIRVMAIDNQRGKQGDIPHRWFVCRALAQDGRSRLVDCGRLDEWDDIKKRAMDLGVPEWAEDRPGPWVVSDRRFDPVEVDEICARFKWFGMMGTDQDEFVHSANSEHAGNRMPFSEERFIDIGFGTQDQGRRHAIYYLFASQKIQDFLALLRDGKAESWELPADIGTFCPSYADQINSHRQRIEQGRKGEERRVWYRLSGWDDHLLDCEIMIVVLGIMAGVFRAE